MISKSGFDRPAPMEGHGQYNRSSRVQAAGLLPAVTLLEQAARDVPLDAVAGPLIVADYGSSEGHNSLVPLGTALSALRARFGPKRAICVVHTDLPDNDFSALFRALAEDPDSYLGRDPALFASAVGRSFYEQILPSDSVTLGWSSWAVQWLSLVPALIPDQVQVAYSQDRAAREAFATQAAEDWRSFLLARARELAPGGRLVVVTMALTNEGEFGYQPLLDAMYGTLIAMIEQGLVREDEVGRMCIPTVGRSEADLTAPFAATEGCTNLALEHLRVFHAEDRIWAEYKQSGDARAFGAGWATFARASVFPTLATALSDNPDDQRAARFFGELEAGLAARLAATPKRMTIPLAEMVIAKPVA